MRYVNGHSVLHAAQQHRPLQPAIRMHNKGTARKPAYNARALINLNKGTDPLKEQDGWCSTPTAPLPIWTLPILHPRRLQLQVSRYLHSVLPPPRKLYKGYDALLLEDSAVLIFLPREYISIPYHNV